MVLTKRFKNLDMINFAIEFYMAPDNSLINGEGGESSFFNTFVVLFCISMVRCKNDPILTLPVLMPLLLFLQTEWVPQNSYVGGIGR